MRVGGVRGKMRVGLLTVLLAAASACDPTADVLSGPFDTRFANNLTTASLDTFVDCSDVISLVKAEALDRVGPWGLEGGLAARPVPANEQLPPGTAPPTADAASGRPATGDASTLSATSTVAGEQPDLVKVDGDRMLTVRGDMLVHLGLAAQTPAVQGTLRLPGGTMADRLVFAGDRALVLSTQWEPTTLASGPAAGISLPYLPSTPRTVIHQIDVSRPAAMTVAATLTIDATVLAASSTDGDLRMVLEHRPDDLGFVLPSGADTAAAERINRNVVADSTIGSWFAGYELERNGRTTTGRLASCDAIHEAPTFSGFGTVTMMSLPIEGTLVPTGTVSLLGDAVAVATSDDGAVVATNKWLPMESSDSTILATERKYRTDLHTFTIGTTGEATYAASGSVAGHPLDAGSLAIDSGNVAIALRDGAPWEERDTTSVASIERRGNLLIERGRIVDPNGTSETQRVRFVGDRAYAGSFRQADPLRIVDLADPGAPRLAASLTLPGFSSHLEPIGQNRIIGVGQDLDNTTGRSRGLRVSLFDVTDPDRPRSLATKTYPAGSSTAQWDPRAVTWSPERRLLVLPVETRSASSATGVTEAVVVRVTDSSIVEVGRIAHSGGTIDRSIIHGDQLLTLSYAGVQASRVTDLGPIAWTPVTF